LTQTTLNYEQTIDVIIMYVYLNMSHYYIIMLNVVSQYSH